jgi:RimJ/RimL family protein N-acetyltransferase
MKTSNIIKQIVFRKVSEDDAEQIIALMKGLAAEPDINVHYTPEEADVPIEKQRQLIKNLGNSFYIVAEVEGKLIGELNCMRDHWSLTGHVAFLGMDIYKDYRNQGIGSEMMRQVIEWAKETGVKRIELEVFARNSPAIYLYEKFGFEVEGTRRRSVFKYGEYLDTLIMGLLF